MEVKIDDKILTEDTDYTIENGIFTPAHKYEKGTEISMSYGNTITLNRKQRRDIEFGRR